MNEKGSALAKNIAYLRKINNISRQAIADALGLKSSTTVQKWEAGVSMPSALTLIELSDMFNISIDCLLKTDIESGKQVSYTDGDMTIHLREQDRELLDKFSKAPDDIRHIVCVALKMRRRPR